MAPGAVGIILDLLPGSTPAGTSGEEVSVELFARWAETVDFMRGQLFIDDQVHGAWLWAQSRARQIGKDLEQIAGDQDWMWRHLTEVILPHTEAFLIGYVWSKGITPLKVRLAKDEKVLRFLMGWRGQIDYWRKYTVDPELAQWVSFLRWFNSNARAPIQTLAGWLKAPGTFSQWAVPIITAPLITYLADKASIATVDELARLVVDATPDVWRHVEVAAAAILNQEV